MKLKHLFIVTLAVWVVISCTTTENPIVNPDTQKQSYREILATLDWGTDTAFVYGHKTPDVDAVTSAEKIFGTSFREGVAYTKDNLSRTQIVPKITDLLK